jgi:AraC-like DNA-binding protein
MTVREPVDRVVVATRDVTLGEFRCPVTYSNFSDAGPITHHVVAFPRSAVWIERASMRRFVADPCCATIYNPADPYRRFPISPDGDLADWLGVSERMPRDAVRDLSAGDAEEPRPFRHVRAAVSTEVYLAQRRLFEYAASDEPDLLAIEESAMDVLARVLQSAYGTGGRNEPVPTRRGRPRRTLAEEAKAALHESLFENLGISDLSERIGVSAFHLCRTFRAETGMTIHEYRREVRLRVALGMTSAYRGNIAALALHTGFYSHSHFTTAFKLAFGVSPSIPVRS